MRRQRRWRLPLFLFESWQWECQISGVLCAAAACKIFLSQALLKSWRSRPSFEVNCENDLVNALPFSTLHYAHLVNLPFLLVQNVLGYDSIFNFLYEYIYLFHVYLIRLGNTRVRFSVWNERNERGREGCRDFYTAKCWRELEEDRRTHRARASKEK